MNQLASQFTRHSSRRTGDLVLFPSWLEHSVAPFEGEAKRICIAFNAKLELTL